ncbi:hypothetical protein Lesp01_54770 [Lentzea sp. NBRC 102530]|nr:hypothetical protein Lesp01_54770 [Lentzea sp. NBRC 102530]
MAEKVMPPTVGGSEACQTGLKSKLWTTRELWTTCDLQDAAAAGALDEDEEDDVDFFSDDEDEVEEDDDEDFESEEEVVDEDVLFDEPERLSVR